MSTPTERPPEDTRTPQELAQTIARAPDHSDHVSEVMIRLVSTLWLAKSVADCQIGDVCKVNDNAWFALSDLLGSAATDLDAALGRYNAEYNAMAKAAESGGAA